MHNSIAKQFTLSVALVLFGPMLFDACYPDRHSLSQNAMGQGVVRDRLQTHWTKDGNWMWYSVNVEAGEIEYYRVDLRSGEKLPLINDAILDALNNEFPQETRPTLKQLNDVQLANDGSQVTFQWKNSVWAVDSNNSVSKSGSAAIDPRSWMTNSRRSDSRGASTELTITNSLNTPVTCFWLGADGDDTEYQTIQPDQSVSQHTYGSHVWSLREQASGKELLRIRATEASLEIELNDSLLDAYQSFLKAIPRRRQRGNAADTENALRNMINEKSVQTFVRDYQVWLREKGDESQLTSDGSSTHRYEEPLRLSPSGSHLLAIQNEIVPKRQVTIVQSSPKDQLQPVTIEFNYVKPGDELDRPHLKLFDLSDNSFIEVENERCPNPYSLTQFRWLHHPERIMFLYNQRGHQVQRVLTIDPLTGVVSVVVEETSDTFIDYAHKTFLRLVNDEKQLVWMSERSGFNHLYLYDITSSELQDGDELCKPITTGEWVVRDVDYIDESLQTIWFTASGIHPEQDPYFKHLCKVDFDGTNLTVLTNGNGDHNWDFSDDRKWIVDRFSRVDCAPVTQLRNASTGELLCALESASCQELLDSGWTIPEPFVAKGRDGATDIYGLIVRPSNFDPAKKYPIVEKIYAGPHSAHVPKSFGVLSQEHTIADLGFIVVRIDGMGTSHRGKAFHDVCWKNLADAGFPDRKAWIRAAADKYQQMDLTRVGIFGGSAGGQNAMRALLDHHDFYHVAVADCGCHDNRMDKMWWNEAWMGWPVDASYENSSNVAHADRLKGKLLLIVGELDRNVDPASTMQVANALVRANKDFDLLIIPGAGHGAAETRYGSRRRADFLVEHLLKDQ